MPGGLALRCRPLPRHGSARQSDFVSGPLARVIPHQEVTRASFGRNVQACALLPCALEFICKYACLCACSHASNVVFMTAGATMCVAERTAGRSLTPRITGIAAGAVATAAIVAVARACAP